MRLRFGLIFQRLVDHAPDARILPGHPMPVEQADKGFLFVVGDQLAFFLHLFVELKEFVFVRDGISGIVRVMALAFESEEGDVAALAERFTQHLKIFLEADHIVVFRVHDQHFGIGAGK